jgi:hypothetical protein
MAVKLPWRCRNYRHSGSDERKGEIRIERNDDMNGDLFFRGAGEMEWQGSWPVRVKPSTGKMEDARVMIRIGVELYDKITNTVLVNGDGVESSGSGSIHEAGTVFEITANVSWSADDAIGISASSPHVVKDAV